MEENNFLGTGWKFPPTFSKKWRTRKAKNTSLRNNTETGTGESAESGSYEDTGETGVLTKEMRGCHVEMVSEEQDICESLIILLNTRPGERVLQPNYGCNLDILLFEPMNSSFLTYVKWLVENAILFFEPRIDLQKVEINTERLLEGEIKVELFYIIRATNSRFNLVYPFYQNEAEIIKQTVLVTSPFNR